MYILTRHNHVIDYCSGGYLCMGCYVICQDKNKTFYDCMIVDIGNNPIPDDLLINDYLYIEGNFTLVGPKAVTSVNGNAPDENGNISLATYTHPTSGVTAGTYKSVTVNAQGHVTGGSNPTTLAGYGITDAPTKTGGGASGTWGINISGKANTAGTADVAKKVSGTYSGNGGQQSPAYFGKQYAGFLMSNANVNSDTSYKNWLYMDNYGGADAGGATALGVSRTAPRAFLMQSDANRSSWNNSAELLSTYNYNSYAPKKDGTGASGTWGINISGNATKDSAGQQINTTYIKGLSISGNTITYTKGNGDTGTIAIPSGASANSYVTEAVYNSNGSWYRKYSDGWLEQGGIVVNSNAATRTTVTLLKPYANTNYTVQYTFQKNGKTNNSGSDQWDVIGTRSTTSFVAMLDNCNGIWQCAGVSQ